MTRPWDARRLRRAAFVEPVRVDRQSMCWMVRGTRWVVLATMGAGDWRGAAEGRSLPPARTSCMRVTALPAHGWPSRGWPVVELNVDNVLDLMTVLACAGDRLRSWDIKQRITVLEIFTGRQMWAAYSSAVALQSEGLRGIAELQQIHDHCLAYEVQLQEPLPWQ